MKRYRILLTKRGMCRKYNGMDTELKISYQVGIEIPKHHGDMSLTQEIKGAILSMVLRELRNSPKLQRYTTSVQKKSLNEYHN